MVILQYPSFFFFFFFLGTLLFNRQPAISSYQNITFDSTILTLCNINITCDCTFVTFGGALIFSHIWWYHPHIVQYQYHMWLYFCHIRWFLFFFSHLMIPSSHYIVLTSYVIVLLSHSVVLLFFLTFDGTILTLHSINITCDCTFVTFIGFFSLSHLMVPSSHCAILTSYVTIFCYILRFIYLFSHIAQYQHHM